MPTKLLLTAAFLLTSTAAQAAPTDWRTSFAPDAVASYLTGDGLALAVVPAGKQPKELKEAKAAAAALSAAVGKAKGKKSFVKAPAAPLAKLEDAEIVTRLKKSKASHVLIVRVAPGAGGAPSATVSIYDMDGKVLDSFTAVAGTALAAKTETKEKAGGDDAEARVEPAPAPATADTASASASGESGADAASSSEARLDSAATAPESKSVTETSESSAESAPASSPAPAGDTGAVPATSSAGSDATVTASESAPAPEVATPPPAAPAESNEMKLRLGLNTGAMYFVPGPSYGVVFAARGGLRLNDWLGAYVDVAWGGGLGVSAAAGTGSGSVAVSAAGYRRFALMGEATWGVLFAAVGPAFVQGAWGGVKANVSTTNGGSAQAFAAEGNFPGLLARAGFQFGSRNRFTLALEISAVIGKVSKADTSTSGAGVKSGDTTLAYSPVVMLGWDLN